MASNVTRDHHLWTRDTVKNVSGDVTLDIAGNIMLDSANGITKFYLNGDTDDLCTLTVAANGATTLATADSDAAAGHLTLDPDGQIILDSVNTVNAALDGTLFKTGGTTIGALNAHHELTVLSLYEAGGASTDDFCSITVDAQGVTTIATVDANAAVGHLTLDVDGNINLDANTGIFNFYDAGDTDDAFKITVAGGTGATILETVSAASPGDGHLTFFVDGYAEFKGCAAGFDLVTPTWGAADGDGTFTTICFFSTGNKLLCTLNRNMGTNDDIDMNFPTTSGNFVLVLLQDGTGSRTVHANAWNCASPAGSGTVKWAGGSAPTLTTTADKADIVSIFWDADNRIAYAVASLNF